MYNGPSAILLLLSIGLFNPAHADCPQYRETISAPSSVNTQTNPLEQSPSNLRAGKKLYKNKEVGCYKCHGKKGDGAGPLALSFAPPPRDFTCVETMTRITDGQLFWIIQNGSPESSMPAHPALREKQIWQIVLFIRSMAK